MKCLRELGERITKHYQRLDAARYMREAKAVEDRLLKPDFKENELTFAATSRCPCGAGLAYPKKSGAFGYWDCSEILMGHADPDQTHTAKLPFTFWEVKSELQPSAYGATTRKKAVA